MKKFKNFSPGIVMIAIIALSLLMVSTPYLEAAKKMAEKGYLGVSIEKVTYQEKKDLGIGHGVRVTQVMEGEAGDKAGIKEGDIILFFDGKKILRPDNLVDSVRETKPGTSVEVKIFRDGKSKKVTAVLGEFKIREMSEGDFMLAPHRSGGYLGVSLKELKGDLSGYFGINPGEGVLILEVSEESPALEAGLKAGDVIVKLDGVDVAEPVDIQEILSGLQAGTEVSLEIIRHKKPLKVKVELGESRALLRNLPQFQNFFRLPSGGEQRLFFDRNFKEKLAPGKELKKKKSSKARINTDNIYI